MTVSARSPTTHRIEISSSSVAVMGFEARCACGWQSSPFKTKDEASHGGRRHVVDTSIAVARGDVEIWTGPAPRDLMFLITTRDSAVVTMRDAFTVKYKDRWDLLLALMEILEVDPDVIKIVAPNLEGTPNT